MALIDQEQSAIGGVPLEGSKAADGLAGVAANDNRKGFIFERFLDGIAELLKLSIDDLAILILVSLTKLFGVNRFDELKVDILVLLQPIAAGKPLDRLYPIARLLAMGGER